MQKVKAFLANFVMGLIIFMAIDVIWIYALAKPVYVEILGHYLHDNIFSSHLYLGSILGVYILLIIGLLVYVLPKSFSLSYTKTFWLGALYGLIIYGVFALTNFSTLNIWSIKLVFVDMIWGAIICGLLALILKRFAFR